MPMTKQEVGQKTAARRKRGGRGRFLPGAIGPLAGGAGFSQVRKTGAVSMGGPSKALVPVKRPPVTQKPQRVVGAKPFAKPEHPVSKQHGLRKGDPFGKKKEELYWKQAEGRIKHHANIKSLWGNRSLARQHDTGITKQLFRTGHNKAVSSGHAPGSGEYNKSLAGHYKSFGHMSMGDWAREKASQKVAAFKKKVSGIKERALFGRPQANGGMASKWESLRNEEAAHQKAEAKANKKIVQARRK